MLLEEAEVDVPLLERILLDHQLLAKWGRFKSMTP
jgi:hypothetical protein